MEKGEGNKEAEEEEVKPLHGVLSCTTVAWVLLLVAYSSGLVWLMTVSLNFIYAIYYIIY